MIGKKRAMDHSPGINSKDMEEILSSSERKLKEAAYRESAAE